jgi:predicted ATPase
MSDTIQKLTIEGFKSIRKLEDFELRSLNVLIGANGAGKSNFVGFFHLLRELVEQRLNRFVEKQGNADRLLYMGPKITRQIVAEFHFGVNGYRFVLEPTSDGRLIFADEATRFTGYESSGRWRSFGSGHRESELKERKDDPGAVGRHGPPYYVFDSVSNWVVYHFHDTSETAAVRRQGEIDDNRFLRNDAANLAAFLYRLSQTYPDHYQKIRDVVRLAAPFFDDFKLRPMPASPNLIQLEWSQTDSDNLFFANQLSDGTLRFICLATALLQPLLPRDSPL